MSVVGLDVGNDTLVAAVARKRGIDVLLNAESKRDPKRLLLLASRLAPRDLPRLPFPVDVGARIHVDHLGRRIALSTTHILAMLLAYLHQLGEDDLDAPVADCVISVPFYLTQAHRRAYADAATVAGLRPLRLMHDLTATTLGYGLYRSDLGVAGEPTFVAFVNVGHSDTQAGVVAFDPSGMKVLSHAFDADLGS
ncbi:hypothetical protein ZWY2020_056951 [Hordeum vulgare]|nr:hypothetical protein ZWY2020_056951 [Hordeum vulgare]